MINLTYKQLKQSILWVSDFYDWPLSGAIFLPVSGFNTCDGLMYWFKCTESGYELTGEIDEEDEPVSQEYRIFTIYNCPIEWWVPVLLRHEDFCKLVGEHWNYENGTRKANFVDKGTCGEFYNKYKDWKQPDLNDSWIIGKCDSRCQD